MSPRPTRQCALCQNERLLCDSHFLPRALYRYLRGKRGIDLNPNPAFINDHFDIQLPSQASDYLLCEECEARFRTNGEAWVLAHCYRGKRSFLLHDLVTKLPLIGRMERFAAYDTAVAGRLDTTKLAYFAASMFWRSAVHRWKLGPVRLFSIRLGKYEEDFRNYLLRNSDFPANAVLSVTVAESKECLPVALFPVSVNDGRYHHHWFRIPGIAFHLYVGNSLDESLRHGCTVRGNVIYMSDIIDTKAMEDVEKAMILRSRAHRPEVSEQ